MLGVRVRVRDEEAGRAVPQRFRGSGDADDIPYNAMLIGAADAHIELRLGTVDEAAEAIHTALVRLSPVERR